MDSVELQRLTETPDAWAIPGELNVENTHCEHCVSSDKTLVKLRSKKLEAPRTSRMSLWESFAVRCYASLFLPQWLSCQNGSVYTSITTLISSKSRKGIVSVAREDENDIPASWRNLNQFPLCHPGCQACVDIRSEFELFFLDSASYFNPFTPELKMCILPTFQKAIVWVM